MPGEPVFIVGNDRSGTTMLRLILIRNPTLAIPTESMIVTDLAAVRRAAGLTGHAEQQRLADRVWNHPKVRLWGLQDRPPVVPPGMTHDAAYRFALEAPYLSYARLQGASRWGDKTPSYVLSIDEILAVWPNARVLNMVRDGRDVALSIIPLPFGGNNVWAAGRDWARGIRAGVAAAARHPEQVLTVRYEDLVADPQVEIPRVCDFLGLDFDGSMLAIDRTDPELLVADEVAWFAKVWGGISRSSVGKWRTQMSPWDLMVFEEVAGPALDALGYERGSRRPRPSPTAWKLWLLGWSWHDRTLRLVNFVRLRLVQERGRELRYVVTRRLPFGGSPRRPLSG